MRRSHFRRMVYLYANELLHDIDAELLKLSKLAAEGEVNQELQTDETRNNRPLMIRRMDYAVAELEGVMQAYLVSSSRTVEDNRMTGDCEYEFELSFPENWQSRTFSRLPKEMHDYVVNSCISDFLKSAYPRYAASYESKAESSKWNVKHCVTSRIPESMRKPSGWF